MAQVMHVAFWQDTGFMDGGVEVPKLSDCGDISKVSGTGGYAVVEKFFPSKGRIFSELKIEGEYEKFHRFTYMAVQISYARDFADREHVMWYFGWVDEVEMMRDEDDFGQVLVRWHVDPWRTYGHLARFGYGIVRRRQRGADDPLQAVPHRYRLGGDFRSMIPAVTGSNLNWLIFTYVNEAESSQVTEVRTCIIPFDKNNLDVRYHMIIGEADHEAPSLNEIGSGKFPTLLGLSASQITSAFISPIPPLEVESVSGTNVTFRTETIAGVTERETGDWDDSRMKRVASMNLSYISYGTPKYVFNTVYSDGTSETRNISYTHIESQGKDYLDSLNGAMNGGILTVGGGVCFNFTLTDIVTQVFPTTVFQNGDTITVHGVSSSRTSSFTGSPSSCSYNVALGEPSILTYTYNNGWPTVRLYSQNRVYGEYTYSRSASTYSIGIDKLTSAQCGFVYSKSQNFASYDIDLGGIKTTDTSELIVTDMGGSPIASSPWGIELGSGSVRPVISSVSAYLQYRFDGLFSAVDGVEFTIPLVPIDIVSNSWSDYVYSGQRDYDVEQRNIAKQNALVQGVTSSLGAAGQGALIGGLKESGYVGTSRDFATPRSIRHMAAFGSIGGLTSLAGAGVNYASMSYFNDRLQGLEETAKAKQFDSITSSGNGWDWLWNGRDIGIITMVADDYSIIKFERSVELSGIEVCEPESDCTAIINGGGPICISDLIVVGAIPSEARNYIKQRIGNGVRLI